MVDTAELIDIAEGIERELKNMKLWGTVAPQGECSTPEHIQFHLLPQLHSIAAGKADMPSFTGLGSAMAREFDGAPALQALFHRLEALGQQGL